LEDANAAKEDKKEGGDNEEKKAEEPKPINDTNPLWLKNPRIVPSRNTRTFTKKYSLTLMIPCSGFTLIWIILLT